MKNDNAAKTSKDIRIAVNGYRYTETCALCFRSVQRVDGKLMPHVGRRDRQCAAR
jgi:hypothetical protein